MATTEATHPVYYKLSSFPFTYGEGKHCQTIKKSQNVMNMIVEHTFKQNAFNQNSIMMTWKRYNMINFRIIGNLYASIYPILEHEPQDLE